MTPAFAQPTLRLTDDQYATIVGSCYGGLPDEACGLLVGPLGGNGVPTGRCPRRDRAGTPTRPP